MTPPRAIVLINAAAGGFHPSLPERIRARFERHGWSVDLEVDPTGRGLVDRAAECVGLGDRVIVAGGGDGTLNAVARRLSGTGAALGVLPLGTRNHFARAVGLAHGWEEAVDAVVAGRTRAIDMGVVGDRLFLNNVSLGVYPRYLALRGELPHGGPRGLLARARAWWRALHEGDAVDYRLESDGGTLSGRAFVLLVSNNPYVLAWGGVRRRPALDGARLGFYIVPETRFRLFALAACVLLKFPPFAGRALVSGSAVLTLGAPAAAGLDGEPLMPPQAVWRFDSLPHALRVYVPARAAADGGAIARSPVYTGGST